MAWQTVKNNNMGGKTMSRYMNEGAVWSAVEQITQDGQYLDGG